MVYEIRLADDKKLDFYDVYHQFVLPFIISLDESQITIVGDETITYEFEEFINIYYLATLVHLIKEQANSPKIDDIDYDQERDSYWVTARVDNVDDKARKFVARYILINHFWCSPNFHIDVEFVNQGGDDTLGSMSFRKLIKLADMRDELRHLMIDYLNANYPTDEYTQVKSARNI